MKIDQEYPATHSMSTAWYVADEEGNVGIMDFNDNGPVPWQTEESCIESLVYGHDEDYKNKIFLPIALTDEQIDDLMCNPHAPEEESLWMDCIIQIDLSKENQFLELAKNPDVIIERCVSKERGLYDFDGYHSTVKVEGKYKVLEDSSLKKIIDQKIILRVFDKQDYWMEDEWAGDHTVHNKNYSSAPYYLFHQPYWSGELPVCMNVPNCPVKLEQVPEKLRERVLRLPVRFKETERFQIAEWYPSAATGMRDRAEIIGGCEYELLPLTDGSEAYICTSIILPSEFYRYCSEKERYNCSDCDNHCYTCWDYCFTNKPTVLAMMHPFEKWDYSRQIKSDSLMWHSAWIPILAQIPYKVRDEFSHDYFGYLSEKEIQEHVSQSLLLVLFQKNRRWIEDLVNRFKPRVILVSDMAKPLLDTVYPIVNNSIEIAGVTFPMYLVSEMEAHRQEIEQLAFMPYQGEQIPYIISVEEMERIKSQQ